MSGPREVTGESVVLLGASVDSGNRGVTALTLGAMYLLHSSLGTRDFAIVELSADERVDERTISVGGEEVTARTFYFSKYRFLWSAVDLLVFRLFGRRPRARLSRLILESGRIFDINEGDSFSDIYGRKRILRHFMDSFLVLLSGKALTFLPQTIGPFGTTLGRSLAKYVLRRARKIYVRDGESANLLTRWRIAHTRSADMAVYMEPKHVDMATGDNTVGVNISGLLFYQAYGRIANRFGSYVSLVNRILDILAEKGFGVLLIPHTYRLDSPGREDDLAAIREIVKMRDGKGLACVDREFDAAELKFLISRLEFFIGSRMHSCIAALSTSVPAVALSYSVKFRGTFEMFDQGQCVIEIRDLRADDVDAVAARVIEQIERRRFIRAELEAVNAGREVLSIE